MPPKQTKPSVCSGLLSYVCLWVCIISLALTSCTLTQLRGTNAELYFAGRLAITQDADPQVPGSKADSWSAHFELAGNPTKGTLLLYTPVGTTVAKLQWEPGMATLEADKQIQTYSSLDELTVTHFEQTLPVAALFDWLQGHPTQQVIPGWDVDLDRAPAGIISAQRTYPPPRVRLRAVVNESEINTPPSVTNSP